MKRFFSEMFRSAKEGFKEGMEDKESKEWQILFNHLNEDLDNASVSDEDLVKNYFDFIARYPDKRILENVRHFLERMMAQRPNTILIIKNYIDRAKQNDQTRD